MSNKTVEDFSNKFGVLLMYIT